MVQFRRAVRFFLMVVGIIAGIITTLTLYLTRFVIRPPRKAPWATPRHFGLAYEDVQFPARDGVRLSGWFIPAAAAARPTVIMVHGWPWNRLGTVAGNLLEDIPGTSPLELLMLAYALRGAGYHVLMFDLRNHGLSAPAGTVTFGLQEANDLLGAVDYLQSRSDVQPNRIGAVGFSMGANTILFTLPRTQGIKAAIAVQPTSPPVFKAGYAAYLLGPLGKILGWVMEVGYPLMARGLRFSAIDPVFAAKSAGITPILYIQSEQDTWGSAADVARMVAATPNAVPPLFLPNTQRFGGYQYLLDHPDTALRFFEQHL
ncbi:MAG: alpha/beta fold hydrolase [Anaerolineales bacterium]|nr:alpha/beta fold hydrolase [Anaerolineales bacterium]MCB8953388.1 alpha/beta fold hydrolase [Ardenticatenales bacterium]